MEPSHPVTGRVGIIVAWVSRGRSVRGPGVLIVLAASFEGAFVVRIPADSAAGVGAKTLAVLFVAAGASGSGFFEEEVQQFVANGEVGLLLELLEGHKPEEGLEEGERGADVVEMGVGDGGGSNVLGRG